MSFPLFTFFDGVFTFTLEPAPDKIKLGKRRRCNIKDRTHSTFDYIVLVIGILLTVGGLCILLINLLRH
ncbi:MAG: hypothetical protein HZA17_08545 [Nitrospirae bacterium]|nr:hypothetical protein [Nitrospirota bacterium]